MGELLLLSIGVDVGVVVSPAVTQNFNKNYDDLGHH